MVQSKPRCEAMVNSVLAQRGIEVYLPLIPAPRRSGQAVTPFEPLFPGYLFSRLTLGTPEWVAARSAPGVVAFLGGSIPGSGVKAEGG